MASTALFGKTGVNSVVAPRPSFTPAPQPVENPTTDQYSENAHSNTPAMPEFNGNDLNELNLSLGSKSEYIAQDKSMIVALLFWLFIGGVGAHRFYLGHKYIGTAFVVTGIIAWGSLFGSGIIALADNFSKQDINMASLIATFGFVLAHMAWMFIDMPYIAIRKLINSYS